MITRNFFEQVRLVSVSFLECPEGCFVAQVFLRDVVIIQVDESSPPQGVGYQSDGSLFSRRKRRGI